MKILINGSPLLKYNLLPCLEAAGHHTIEHPDEHADLILGLNELEISAHQSFNSKIPMAIWFTDTHKFQSENAPDFLKENSFMFCFSEAQQLWFSKAGWQHSFYLPLAVNSTLFKPLQKTKDISFMGELRHMTADSPMVQLLHPLRLKANPSTPFGNELQSFFKVIHNFLEKSSKVLNPIKKEELYDDFCNSCPVTFHKYINLFDASQWQAALFENHNALLRASVCRLFENELEINGTYEDWSTLGDWPKHLKKRASYPQEWSRLCGSSNISLNLFRPDPMHGIPLKAFEIASCSLLFTNEHPMLKKVFTPDVDCISFQSLKEARSKYHWLKNNPEKILEISQASRSLMLKGHQYTHRWQTIEESLRDAGLID